MNVVVQPERCRLQPPERRTSRMPGLPEGPAIPMGRRVRPGKFGTPFGPADELVERINHGGRMLGPESMPVGVAERRQIEQHGHASTRGLGQLESMADKRIAKTSPVRRIGDDVFGASRPLAKEIDVAGTVAPVDEVGGDNVIAGFVEYAGNMAFAACRLPDGAVEGLDGQKRPRRLRRCRIELSKAARIGWMRPSVPNGRWEFARGWRGAAAPSSEPPRHS